MEKNLFNRQLFGELERLKPLLFNETNPTRKQNYKQRIDELISQITNGHKEFDFEVYFSEVFHEKKGFDVVIANPPYVRQESLSNKDYFSDRYKTYHGMADLYTYFIEKGFAILRLRGILSFIISNRFTHTNYGINLRRFLSKRDLIAMINFNGAEVFESANVDTLVMILVNGHPDENKIQICNLKQKITQSIQLNDYICSNSFYASKGYFVDNQWSFSSNKTLCIKEKISKKGKPLISIDNISVNRGITTGLNNVFVINEKIRNNLVHHSPNSNEIIRPILKGGHIKRWHLRWDHTYLIYTYTGIDIDNYPSVKDYLSRFKDELKNVWEAKKGKKKWYELRPCSYYSEFKKEKIVYTRLSNINSFSISTNGEYCLDSAGIIITKDNEYYCAILNSKVIHFYFDLVAVIWGKDGIKWFGKSFDTLPVYQINYENRNEVLIHDNITECVDRILSITKDEDYLQNLRKQAHVRALEQEIDQMVYQLYGLTAEEIRTVEGDK